VCCTQRKSCLLLCLAVPATVSLDVLLARAHVDQSSVVSVHVSTGQQISLLLQFTDQEGASRFHERWHGHLFDRSRTEVCHVFYLTTATFVAPLAAPPLVRLPMPALPLETKGPSDSPPSEHTTALASSVAPSGGSTTGEAPAWLPPLHVELPICPVCLERLDTNISGLVAVPYDDEEELSRCRVA
jgi:BRCA1-associated protein